MKKILLIDTNNTVMRWTATTPKAINRDGLPIGGIYGMFNTIHRMVSQQGFTSVIAVLDWGVPKYRLDIYPQYKGQREADRKKDPRMELAYTQYKEQMTYVVHTLQHSGVITARAKSWEGDDVIAGLALRRFSDLPVTILSTDKDFCAIASPRVKVFDATRREETPEGSYREPDEFYSMERLMDPKSSDNLSGVTGIGKVKAARLVNDWRASVGMDWHIGKSFTERTESFLRWCSKQPDRKECNAVTAEQQNVRINRAITDMHWSAEQCDPCIKFRRSVADREGFQQTCREYGLLPILQDFSAIWPAFNSLTCPV